MIKISSLQDLKNYANDKRLYYILAPALAALWPLFAGLVALSNADSRWTKQNEIYTKGSDYITQILRIDPERLNKQKGSAEFSYPNVVNRVAGSVGVSPSGYRLQVKAVVKVKGGQESQDADVTLTAVDMVTFTKFLSAMQLEGAGIQCSSVSLQKQKGSADLWTAQMAFKYFRG
jgi:hypothetical protein